MGKKISKKPSILYKDINEFNIKLILIIGVIFIMLSGYTSYALFTDAIVSSNIISLKVGKKTSEKTFTYTGNCEEYTAPYNGYYKIEAWGAQGGCSKGGKGGYTSGITKLAKGDTLYVCVGGKGGENETSANVGGYNGGGYSGDNGVYSCGGGGATDVRLVQNVWNNTEGLNSRIMVAAGGAGGVSWLTTTAGSGGGLHGGDGTTSSSDYNTSEYLPTGGTQTTGGNAYNSNNIGKFGYGVQTNTAKAWGGGGGSGYYGGGTGHGTTGSGGSSFISGYAGVSAITSSSNRTHTNDTLHYSNKYFINAKMEVGANSGNGKAKITYISSTKPERKNVLLDGVRYIKDCTNGNSVNNGNHTVELQAIYNGVNIVLGKILTESHGYLETTSSTAYSYSADGKIENINGSTGYSFSYSSEGKEFCLVTDLGDTYDLDEVAVWHYWLDGRTYNDNYTYVSSDNTNWTLVIDKQEPETSQGKRVNAYEKIEKKYVFTYTGACEEFEVKTTGSYKIEAWGAGGGYSLCNGSKCNSEPGKGGYTSGIMKLLKGETLNICVGGKGADSVKSANSAGGYNGGGLGTWDNSDDETSGGGGGATDIRLVGGTWDNATGLNSRIMVAAGGGGDSWTFNGGSGGGLIGKTTYSSNSVGTQISGYAFGKGADATGVGDSDGVGGGGSGYYGGYAPNQTYSAGTGGSSFISGYAGVNAITSSTDRTHTNNTLHYSNKYFIQGETKSGVRTGNGLAVITLLDSEPVRTNKALDGVRYIKDCTTGNTATAYKSWMEIQAIKNGVNVAKGKTVTGTGELYSDDSENTWSYDYVTDGKMDDGKSAYTRSEGNQCVTVDLGQTYDLEEIAVWHWYEDGRTYTNNYTYVSSDNANWIKVIDREEPETSEGKRVNAYEGANLTIEQSKGGTITCTNNTTNQTSTTSLTVTEGDSITCKVNLSTNYELTSLKIEDTSITNNTAFTYAYKGNTRVTATYYCNDTTGPTITISNDSNGNWTFGPVKMTVNATDQSGVSSIYYRYDSDSSTTKRNDWSSTSSITNGIQAKGTWSAARDNYVYITATDTLGNENTVSTRVRIKSCGCGYRSSTYKNVPQWYHSADSSYHTTAYLHLCKCSDGKIYNCTSSNWSTAGGSGCYVHTGYNTYTALDYSWSNYSGSYW